MTPGQVRHLVVVLGDQLDTNSSALEGFDPQRDAVWMAEAARESTRVRSHQARIVVFLAAMRHFRDALRQRGFRVHYRELDDPANRGTLPEELAAALSALKPVRVVMAEPGEWRLQESLRKTVAAAGIEWEMRPDTHFFCSRDEFARHAAGRKQLRMEFFYRDMRRKTGVLMDRGQPVGGAWNFDAQNRGHFGREGPGLVPRPVTFAPDKVTRGVIALVRKTFPKHPGNLDRFDFAVTAQDAETALEDFITNRLADFGTYQDAMWTGEALLYHSRLSLAMNLKLLDPRRVVAAAEQALQEKRAPLAAVEGFIRQILGWREFVRGIYWQFMPDYLKRNELDATAPLPSFYWTGDTDMNCLRQAIGQTLELGYAHHIQRLMVTGLYALLLGVRPQEVHLWYLAVYIDAVEWVELPNTLGMSQFGDGGVMASKPYVASGKYIDRMTDYCRGCRYHPDQRTGPEACPFTTLYWDFLARHEKRLARNPRMTMQLRNLARLAPAERAEIERQAAAIKRAQARDAGAY